MIGHVGDVVDAWLDGEVTTAEDARIRHHLAGCAACRELAAGAEALRALLHAAVAAAPVSAAETFWRRLAPMLPERRVDLGIAWLWAGPMLVSAGMALAVPVIALVVSAGVLTGRPLWQLAGEVLPWLGRAGAQLAGPVGEAIARPAGGQALLGAIERVPTGVALWLPGALFLVLAGLMTLVFMGWALAALRRPAARPTLSC